MLSCVVINSYNPHRANSLTVGDTQGAGGEEAGSKSRQDVTQVFWEVITVAHYLSFVPILNLNSGVHNGENDLACEH